MAILIQRTDGGVSIMRLIGDADAKTCIAQWQAVHPGLYAGHREVPDKAIPTDRSERNKWADAGAPGLISIAP